MKRRRMPEYIAKLAAKLQQAYDVISGSDTPNITPNEANETLDGKLYAAMSLLVANRPFATRMQILPQPQPVVAPGGSIPSGVYVTTFSPKNPDINTDVTVSGSGFLSATHVTHAGTPALFFTVVNDTTLVARFDQGYGVITVGSNHSESSSTPVLVTAGGIAPPPPPPEGDDDGNGGIQLEPEIQPA